MPVTLDQLQKGTRVKSLNFGWMEAVSEPYPSGLSRGDFRIDVRFDDTGTVRKGVIDRYFFGGHVRDGSVEIPKGVGGRYNTFQSGVAEIIAYEYTHDLTVRFLNTGNEQAAQLDALVAGIVKDRKLFSDIAAKNLEEEHRVRAEREEAYAKIKAEKDKIAAEKKEKRDKYLEERKAKRDAEEEKSRIRQAETAIRVAARRAEKISNLEKALKVEVKELCQEKNLDDIVNVDFKDREGNWVLRFSYNGKFMQTRLGKIHNNLTQRVKKGGSYSTFCSTYNDVGISETFQDAQKFCDWAVQQKGWGMGYQLDKDLLNGEDKIYSETTCAFLPSEINVALIRSRKTNVHRDDEGYYYLEMRLGRLEVSLTGFETRDAAMDAYRKYKEAYVRKLATEYREAISEEAYEALMAWRLKVSE